MNYYLVVVQASQQLVGDDKVNCCLVRFQVLQQLSGDSGKLYRGRGVLLVILKKLNYYLVGSRI